jgi:lipopolysaccharide export system permease protein
MFKKIHVYLKIEAGKNRNARGFHLILSRYIFKEILKTQLSLFVILTAVFLCQSFVQILTRATKGDIPASLVTQVLMLSIPNMSVFMLPLTVFLAVLITHARLSGDSEMVVMRSFGVSPLRNLTISFVVALVTAAVALFNSMYLLPMSMQKQANLLDDAKENASYFALDSGKFIKLGGGTSRVVAYVDELTKGEGKIDLSYDKNDKDKKDDGHSDELRRMKNIYLFFRGNDRYPPTYAVASGGNIAKDKDGIMWFIITNGKSYTGPNNNEQYAITNFDEYRFWISESNDEAKAVKPSVKNSTELIANGDRASQAELQWRISVAVAIPVLTLIVVPLGGVKPRQGKFTKLLPALLIFGSYFLFCGALKNLVDRGSFPVYPGLYLVPVLFLLFFAIPLNLVETQWYRRRLLRRRAVK